MTNPAQNTPPALWIGSPETEIEADPTHPTVIGRMGDLVVGSDNPQMHRRLLMVSAESRMWRLSNIGRHIPVYITKLNGILLTTLPPGASTIIEWPEFLLTFMAGPHSYYLDCWAEIPHSIELSLHTLQGEETIGLGPLSDGERLILAALGQDVLRSKTLDYSLMWRNSDVAEYLGWSRKQFDHRLDDLCARFAAHGIGVTQSITDRAPVNAVNRRIKVLQHAIEARLISIDDLSMVEAAAVSS